mmetsp:Transcript_114568/g.286341  ORF Transcript_114568/g.286341 Transcript_114568/m.286341 type:complete len:221 (+) Transcript_114568:525-1187(+)
MSPKLVEDFGAHAKTPANLSNHGKKSVEVDASSSSASFSSSSSLKTVEQRVDVSGAELSPLIDRTLAAHLSKFKRVESSGMSLAIGIEENLQFAPDRARLVAKLRGESDHPGNTLVKRHAFHVGEPAQEFLKIRVSQTILGGLRADADDVIAAHPHRQQIDADLLSCQKVVEEVAAFQQVENFLHTNGSITMRVKVVRMQLEGFLQADQPLAVILSPKRL